MTTRSPGAYQTTAPWRLLRAFVTKLDATGSSLVTRLPGGHGIRIGFDVAGRPGRERLRLRLDRLRRLPVTPGALQTTYAGGGDDAFVAKLDATARPSSTRRFLGGTNYEGGLGIAVNAAGRRTWRDRPSPPIFPVTPGAYQPVHAGGGYDAFVTRLDATGSSSCTRPSSARRPRTRRGRSRSSATGVHHRHDDVGRLSDHPGAYQMTNAGGGDIS